MIFGQAPIDPEHIGRVIQTIPDGGQLTLLGLVAAVVIYLLRMQWQTQQMLIERHTQLIDKVIRDNRKKEDPDRGAD